MPKRVLENGHFTGGGSSYDWEPIYPSVYRNVAALAPGKPVVNWNSQIFSTKKYCQVTSLSPTPAELGAFKVLERERHQTRAFPSFPGEPALPQPVGSQRAQGSATMRAPGSWM